MNERHRRRRGDTVKAWLMMLAGAIALALSAARCDKNVTVGVDPGSDAAAASGDAAAGDGG